MKSVLRAALLGWLLALGTVQAAPIDPVGKEQPLGQAKRIALVYSAERL